MNFIFSLFTDSDNKLSALAIFNWFNSLKYCLENVCQFPKVVILELIFSISGNILAVLGCEDIRFPYPTNIVSLDYY